MGRVVKLRVCPHCGTRFEPNKEKHYKPKGSWPGTWYTTPNYCHGCCTPVEHCDLEWVPDDTETIELDTAEIVW